MDDAPLYTSKRRARNLWQRYRIYPGRIELQAWFLLHTLVVPADEIRGIEVRPSALRGRNKFVWGFKIDNCDFCRHVLLTKRRGLFKCIAFAPDEPETFAEIGRSIMTA
jgi:hypothetical protein